MSQPKIYLVSVHYHILVAPYTPTTVFSDRFAVLDTSSRGAEDQVFAHLMNVHNDVHAISYSTTPNSRSVVMI